MTTPLIRKPMVSEKATDLSKSGKYVFIVEPHATKSEVRKAVQKLYKVDVTDVNIIWQKPKSRRFRGHRMAVRRPKKAIVTLKSGQTIDAGV